MLNLPSISTRMLSYNGYPMTLYMLSHESFIYELPEGRIVEVGSTIIYTVLSGDTIVLTKESFIYKELIRRVLGATVLEDGMFNYKRTLM